MTLCWQQNRFSWRAHLDVPKVGSCIVGYRPELQSDDLAHC